MVRVSSHWDARTSRINGETFDSFDDALTEIKRFVGDDCVAESVDGATQSWLVYPDEETAETDADGSRPWCTVASIEVVRKERE